VYEKSLGIRHFEVLLCPEEAKRAPSWATGLGRDGRNEKNGSDGTGQVYNFAVRKPKRKSWIINPK
jgi:hypothetical protein